MDSIPADVAAILEFVDPHPFPPAVLDDLDSEAEVEDQIAVDAEMDADDDCSGMPLKGEEIVAKDSGMTEDGEQQEKPSPPQENLQVSLKTKAGRTPLGGSDSSDDDSLSSGDESDTSSSASSSTSGRLTPKSHAAIKSKLSSMEENEACSDEEGNHDPATLVGPTTKNEVVMPEITAPSIEYVGDDEQLELVGDIFKIIDYVIVIKGAIVGKAEKVLDSGSLLVFEDRKVLGEIFETFGPTTQPMYSVRFASATLVDSTQIALGRNVFHVPARSFYVFTRNLRALKGSDASNQHDEEVGDSEQEFSDDEQEMLHRQMLKRRKQPHKHSDNLQQAHPTLSPIDTRYPQMNDYGDIPFNSNPYDDPPPTASSSTYIYAREAPAPYDFISPEDSISAESTSSVPNRGSLAQPRERHSPEGQRNNSRGNGRGRHRGRGGGRGDGQRHHGRGRGRGAGVPPRWRNRDQPNRSFSMNSSYSGNGFPDEYDPRMPQTSLPTNDYYESSTSYVADFSPAESFNPSTQNQGHPDQPWSPFGFGNSFPHPNQFAPPNGMDGQGVVPHINPLFLAGQFGMTGYRMQMPPDAASYRANNAFRSPTALSTPLHPEGYAYSAHGSAVTRFSSLPRDDDGPQSPQQHW